MKDWAKDISDVVVRNGAVGSAATSCKQPHCNSTSFWQSCIPFRRAALQGECLIKGGESIVAREFEGHN